ncbi:hypothetical protein L6452_17838 [Arctium lappa]|uniref:Uncharacterized protein n=1 Tax=Arctium lappa TaxID=4217 RepID=A0ACB9C4H9_ARCLA|nr:hypothetical protein L6452_17838 [Arctium lappa]
MVPISVFRSRRPLRLKTSSAEDVFGRRHLRKTKISQSSEAKDFLVLGAEDLSVLRAEDLSVFRSPKMSTLQAKTLQDKRYILYLAEDLCPSLAQQVSHAFNA